MNNHDETDGESEDIQHHDIDNNKAIQNDTPNQKVDDKTIKMLLIKKKNDNRENKSAETKVK